MTYFNRTEMRSLFLATGMWLVRPAKGHGVAYRVAFAYLHLQAACHLLEDREQEQLKDQGVRPVRPCRPGFE